MKKIDGYWVDENNEYAKEYKIEIEKVKVLFDFEKKNEVKK